MPEPQLCKKCTPPHYHLDHSYRSHKDAKTGQVIHVYSCKLCPCNTELTGASLDAFKGLVIQETGLAM